MEYQNSLEYPEDYMLYNLLDNAFISSLCFLGATLISQLCMFTYTVYKLGRSDTDKKLKIIRGVPGTGKKSYVYYLEDKLNRDFLICDWNEFFTKDDGYEFNGKEMDKAETYSFNKFLNGIILNLNRIYVIGHFPKKWQYDKYIKLAIMNGYKVDITELECENIQELSHYNKRSIHKVPYHKSHDIYSQWEDDERAYKRCPYLGDNIELQNQREKCLINSDDDDDGGDNSCNSNFLPELSSLSDPGDNEITYLNYISEIDDDIVKFD